MSKQINAFAVFAPLEFEWHGTQSDPTVSYKGKNWSYWDLQEVAYEVAESDGIDLYGDEDAFEEWCKANAERLGEHMLGGCEE